MLAAFHQFLRDESGATAIEYGLITSIISVATIETLQDVSVGMTNTFQIIADTLNTTNQGR